MIEKPHEKKDLVDLFQEMVLLNFLFHLGTFIYPMNFAAKSADKFLLFSWNLYAWDLQPSPVSNPIFMFVDKQKWLIFRQNILNSR